MLLTAHRSTNGGVWAQRHEQKKRVRRGSDFPQVWARPEGKACPNTHLTSLPCSVCSNVGCGCQEQHLALKGSERDSPHVPLWYMNYSKLKEMEILEANGKFLAFP